MNKQKSSIFKSGVATSEYTTFVFMSEIKLIYLCVYYPFKVPWNFIGFNPTSFNARFQSQLQGMNRGLQNLGANIQAMTENIVANSISQAQSSFQTAIADKIRRAEAAGTTFDFSELRPGEFRQFTDREGNTRGFSRRYGSGILKKAQCWIRTHLQAKCPCNSLISRPPPQLRRRWRGILDSGCASVRASVRSNHAYHILWPVHARVLKFHK